MMRELNTRETIKINFRDLSEAVTAINPNHLIITFETIRTAAKDIGALCYLRRSKPSQKDRIGGRKVDLTSLDKQRVEQVRDLINTLLDISTTLREKTLEGMISRFIYFVDWCDNNGHSSLLDDTDKARRAFKAYLYFLKDQVRLEKIKPQTAAEYQNIIIDILKEYFHTDAIIEGIKLFKRGGNEPTVPQDEDNQSRIIGWCSALFEGFSDLVLNERDFPYHLAIPNLPSWETDHLWVFPTNKMYMPPHELKKRDSLKFGHWAYDYSNGRINPPELISEKYSGRSPINNARVVVKQAHKAIAAANEDKRHLYRCRLASIASQTFLQLFYANTGQNTHVEQIEWSSQHDTAVSRQGFRAIKNRGHKGEILFEIQQTFLPTFYKYLKLRDWILDDTDCELLFFTRGNTNKEKPRAWAAPTTNLNALLKLIDPEIPNFGSRQWRANRSHYLNENANDLATAAIMLNHSVESHKKSYMAGTEGRTAEELSLFYENVVRSVKDGKIKHSQHSSTGHCDNYGEPEKTDDIIPIEPNCHQPEGCLFCKHYYLHIDKKDIRKLASCRYVISKTQHLSYSPAHFESTFRKVLERIDGLIEHIRQRGSKEAELVDSIIYEVEVNRPGFTGDRFT